jgi:5-methylcytosine-specific restriction endonuclease McrA
MGKFMFYANCKNCEEKMEYGSRQAANTAKRNGAICGQCRERIKSKADEAGSKRSCPECNAELQYKTAAICRAAQKKNLSCVSCSKKSENYSGLKRICPSCSIELVYKTTDSVTRANKQNDTCKSCSLKGRLPSEQCMEAARAAVTGRKLSEEHIQIIKDANTGLKRSEETKKKMSDAMSGRTFSEETTQKMSNSAKNRPPISEETREKFARLKRGTTHSHSDVVKEKIAKAHLGRSHSKRSKRNMKIAQNKRYFREPDWKAPFTIGELRAWASRAKKKTPYCEDCGAKEELHAHHIKPKSIYPDLALKEDNAKVLCKTCHMEFHKINRLNDNQ